MLERGRADIDEGDLDELGRLDGKARDRDPVARTEDLARGGEVQHEQHQTQNGGGPAQGLDVVQIPQPPAEEEKEKDARNQEHHMAHELRGRGRRTDAKAERTEEERDRLRLKARAVHRAHEEIAQPLDENEREEGQHGLEAIFLLGGDEKLQHEQQLHERKEEERGAGMNLPAGDSALFLLQGTVLVAVGGELHHVLGAADDIAVDELLGLLDLLAVEEDPAAAAEIGDVPVALIIARDDGVDARDVLIRQTDVGGFGAANNALPVLQRVHLALRRDEIAPGFGVGSAAEHGAHAAKQHHKRQNGQQKTRHLRQNRQQLIGSVEIQLRHAFSSLQVYANMEFILYHIPFRFTMQRKASSENEKKSEKT